MAKVSRARGSWLRLCEFTSVEFSGMTVSYFELPEYPDIPDQDDDILHVVTTGDRIDKLAHRYYGDHRLWWVISVKNGIDQPATGMNRGDEITVPSPRWVREGLVR